MTSGAGARRKGHAFERACAHEWQEMGWEGARTTRAARGGDWSLTDNGTDLEGTWPFAVQCKRLKQYVSVNTIEEITKERKPTSIEGTTIRGSRMELDFAHDNIPLLLTKADGKPTMAILPWADLQKILRDSKR